MLSLTNPTLKISVDYGWSMARISGLVGSAVNAVLALFLRDDRPAFD